jgi:hypothetical protein
VGEQAERFIMADQLPKSVGHLFYRKLNQLLTAAGFDPWIENLCEPFYAKGKDRPGVPPGTYFRMLLAAKIYPADQGDTHTLEDSVNEAQWHVAATGSDETIQDVVADRGYHANETLTEIAEHSPGC